MNQASWFYSDCVANVIMRAGKNPNLDIESLQGSGSIICLCDYGKPHSVPFTVTLHFPLYLNLCISNSCSHWEWDQFWDQSHGIPWTHTNRKQGTLGRRRRRKEWLGHLSFAPEINGMPWQCTAGRHIFWPLKNTWCVGLGENCQPDTYNYIHTRNQHNIS